MHSTVQNSCVMEKIKINKSLKKPIYQQIFDWVIEGIHNGIYETNTQLQSINEIATENQLARETVVKAFRLLQEKGIVKAVHGKGFFIASKKTQAVHHIFLLFDTLSPYKEVLYEAIHKEFGENAVIDIYFHHFNPKAFKSLVKEAAGNYTSYLVLPFDTAEITEMLEPIPTERLYLLDRKPRFYKNEFQGVYQDFNHDIKEALSKLKNRITVYKKLILVYHDAITQLPLELLEGFKEFCQQQKIEYGIIQEPITGSDIKKHTAYISIGDKDLVKLVETAQSHSWEIGTDIGIISYNDTPLKKVVANGITVISSNFEKMGCDIAQMVLNHEKKSIANPASLINRRSF